MTKYRASKLEIRKLTAKEQKDFFNKYHKQKYVVASVAYGLFNDNILVQAESFGIPRIERQNGMIWHDWELLRECSKNDCIIHGGKSRLLKAFAEEYHPLNLLSYCNTTAGFDGHSYSACGFKLERTSKDYWYEYKGEKIARYKMQKNSNKRAKGEIEPIQRTLEHYGKTYYPEKTEKENAIIAGFRPVEGTGQQVWSKIYSQNIGYVYKITHKESGRIYIGQHKLLVDGSYKKVDYFGSGTHITAAVKKYGKRSFKKEVLEWTDDLSALGNIEHKWIMKYAEEYGKENMFNIDFNIDCTSKDFRKERDNTVQVEAMHKAWKGQKHTAKTKKLLSEIKTGRKLTEETKEKIREARKHQDMSFMQTEEYKEVARQAALKVVHHMLSKEHRKRISDSLKGKDFKNRYDLKGKHWYTNGINNIALNDDEEIPEGFRRGKCQKKR